MKQKRALTGIAVFLAVSCLMACMPLIAFAYPEFSTDGSCVDIGCHTEEEMPDLVGHTGDPIPEEDLPKIKEIEGADYFTCSARGFGGDVEVTIAVLDGKIADLVAIGQRETPDIGAHALEQMPAAILAAQSVEVDAVAGATFTSRAIREAALAAMVEAGLAEAPAAEPEPEAPAEIEGADYFTGTARGFGGDVEVTIAIKAGEIVDVEIAGASETPGIGSNAVDRLPEAIVAAQSWDVDSVAGATVTSGAIREAAQQAMASAGLLEADAHEETPAPAETPAPVEVPSVEPAEPKSDTALFIIIGAAVLAFAAAAVVFSKKGRG